MPEAVYTQNFPDAQWGDFWEWTRGADSTPGPSSDTIDLRPVDVIVPPPVLDLPDVSEILWNLASWPIDLAKGAAAGAKDTLDKSATSFFGNLGKSLGQMMGILVIGGIVYVAVKGSNSPRLNLSSKAT